MKEIKFTSLLGLVMKISLGYILGEDINSFRRLFNLYYPPPVYICQAIHKR